MAIALAILHRIIVAFDPFTALKDRRPTVPCIRSDLRLPAIPCTSSAVKLTTRDW